MSYCSVMLYYASVHGGNCLCSCLLYVSTIVENLHSTSFFQLRLAGDFNCMEWVVSGYTIIKLNTVLKAVVTLSVRVCHQSPL